MDQNNNQDINPNKILNELGNMSLEEFQSKMSPEAMAQLQNGETPKELQDVYQNFFEGVGKVLNPERRSAVAKQLLDEKYQKEFEIIEYRGQNLADDFYTVDAYEKTYPFVPIEARVALNEESVKDAYVFRIGCEMIKDKISRNLDTYPGALQIFVESWMVFSDLTAENIDYMTLANLFPKNKYAIHLFFEEGGQKPEDLQQVLKGLESYKGNIKLYVIPESAKEEIVDYLESNSRLHTRFKEITNDYYIGKLNFENGQIELDENVISRFESKLS